MRPPGTSKIKCYFFNKNKHVKGRMNISIAQHASSTNLKSCRAKLETFLQGPSFTSKVES